MERYLVRRAVWVIVVDIYMCPHDLAAGMAPSIIPYQGGVAGSFEEEQSGQRDTGISSQAKKQKN